MKKFPLKGTPDFPATLYNTHGMFGTDDKLKRRAEICRKVGLRDETEAYRLISSSAKEGAAPLMAKGLNARLLQDLGYEAKGLRKMGYPDEALQRLGFPGFGIPTAAPGSAGEAEVTGHAAILRQKFKDGWRAPDFKRDGWNIQHLKKAGLTITELQRAGFMIEEIVASHSAAEMRRSGFGARELRRYFSGSELRTAGFCAADMRNAGFGIRDLLGFGFNENHVRVAGFSIVELTREGLTKQIVDKSKFH